MGLGRDIFFMIIPLLQQHLALESVRIKAYNNFSYLLDKNKAHIMMLLCMRIVNETT